MTVIFKHECSMYILFILQSVHLLYKYAIRINFALFEWILYLTTMYVYCVYPATSKKSENLSDLNKKGRNKRHSSPFINVVKGVFFVVRITLVPVSYLSAPSAGQRLAILSVSKARTNKFYIYRQCTYIVYVVCHNTKMDAILFCFEVLRVA
jgi:hypothetical protein